MVCLAVLCPQCKALGLRLKHGTKHEFAYLHFCGVNAGKCMGIVAYGGKKLVF